SHIEAVSQSGNQTFANSAFLLVAFVNDCFGSDLGRCSRRRFDLIERSPSGRIRIRQFEHAGRAVMASRRSRGLCACRKRVGGPRKTQPADFLLRSFVSQVDGLEASLIAKLV